MKITLISLDQIIISYGVRCISSYLKQNGFNVEIIFLRCATGKLLSCDFLNKVAEQCNDSNIIGVSLLSNHLPQAIALTKVLKEKTKALIVWGGVHPTFDPETSIQYADVVCRGEGEMPMLQLASSLSNNKDYSQNNGLWVKQKDKIIKNPVGEIIKDIDSLPYFDSDLESHYIRHEGNVVKMDNGIFEQYLTKRMNDDGKFVPEYYISVGRGCLFKCSFCASSAIKKLYPNQKYYRLHSIEYLINEVGNFISKFPFIKWIYFSDDDIFAMEKPKILEFSKKWKEKINLPFYATVSPYTYDEDKMKLLVESGLKILNMGIQSISKSGCESLKRFTSIEKVREHVNSIHKFKDLIMPPMYDFILDNPYEDHWEKLENVKFMLEIPLPKKFQLFALVPFPGTEIYDRLIKEGNLKDFYKEIYNKNYSYPKSNYINMMYYLASLGMPNFIMRLLMRKNMVRFFVEFPLKYLFKLIPYKLLIFLVNKVVKRKYYFENRFVYDQ